MPPVTSHRVLHLPREATAGLSLLLHLPARRLVRGDFWSVILQILKTSHLKLFFRCLECKQSASFGKNGRILVVVIVRRIAPLPTGSTSSEEIRLVYLRMCQTQHPSNCQISCIYFEAALSLSGSVSCVCLPVLALTCKEMTLFNKKKNLQLEDGLLFCFCYLYLH